MKKLIISLCLILVSIVGFSQWIALNSGIGSPIHSIFFTNATTGYAVGWFGTMLKTTDAGNSWTSLSSGNSIDFNSVYFTDANTGYAVGSNGIILKTTNAGTNWVQKTSGTNSFLNSVLFTNSDTGYIVGANGIILKTTNAGNNWVELSSGTGVDFTTVYFTGINTGYVAGLNDTILKTNDGGNSWIAQTCGTLNKIYALYFTDANTGFAVGRGYGPGTIYKTSDAGNNWIAQSSGTNDSLFSVCFTNVNTGYIVGQNGRILKTTNGGANWTTQTSGTVSTLHSVYFSDSNTGYIGGREGIMLKTLCGSSYLVNNPQTVCNGGSYTINGHTYSVTGTFQDIFTSVSGCDSTVITQLTVNPVAHIYVGADQTICPGASAQLTATGGVIYHWSNGSNSASTTVNPSITTNYIVTITDQNGCIGTGAINVTIAKPYANEQICLVTVDTSTWKNKIIWEKTVGVGTSKYYIYKEVAANVYNLIGIVPFNNNSYFIDTTSIPESHADKYKISVVDTCTNESSKSYYHLTMNLVISTNGSTMGLSWSPYKDESNNFSPGKYYIFRGTQSHNMALLDSISSSFTSYNDLNVTANYYYMVGIKKPGGCDISKSNASMSFSNSKKNFTTGIEEISNTSFSISPNPAIETITLSNSNLSNTTAEIFTIEGKTVEVCQIKDNKIDIKDLPQGFYLLRIIGEKEVFVRRFVKK